MLAVFATIDLILYFALPHTVYHICIATFLTKLYTNSLLALFNSRVSIIGSRDSIEKPSEGGPARDVGARRRAHAPRSQIVFRDPLATTASTLNLGISRDQRTTEPDAISLEQVRCYVVAKPFALIRSSDIARRDEEKPGA